MRNLFESGVRLFQNREIEAAIRSFHDAERSGSDPNRCAAFRWDCWMLLGEFERAWVESDAIAARSSGDPHALWDGKPFTGKRVILRCLHGLGDTIQFIRYAPRIRAEARELTVEVHPELVRLLKFSPGIDRVVTWGEALEWDSQVEINELPRVFRTTPRTIPPEVPYFAMPAPGRSSGFERRAGVIWQSSQWNPARSIPFEQLCAALKGTGLDLVSLQFGPERNLLPPAGPVPGDVLDTALDMSQLDLIISADTMTAHLAGALGLAVWVFLPFQADWRWMLDRSDTPWYPTMRLFRQRVPGDWSSVCDELRRAAFAF